MAKITEGGYVRRVSIGIALVVAAALGGFVPFPVGAATALTLSPISSPTRGGKHAQYSPQAAVSSNGRMLVTWLSGEDGTLVGELGWTGGGWMRPQRLFAGGGSRVEGLGSNGTAAVAWLAGDGESAKRATILLAIAPPGHRFGPAKIVTSGPWLSAPSGVVVRPDGQVVLDWLRSLSGHDGNPSEIEYAVARATGAIHAIALGMSGRFGASIAETERGAVLLAYPTPLGFLPYAPNQQAAAAVMPVGASNFGAPSELEYDKVDPYGGASFEAAVAGPGRAVLEDGFYTRQESGTEVRTVEDDGTLGPPRKLASGPLYSQLNSSVEFSLSRDALGADGALVQVWEETRFKGEYGGPLVAEAVMATVTPDGASAIAAPQQIYSSAQATAPSAPVVVSFGDSTVGMWTEDVAARSCRVRVFYAYRPSAGQFSGRLAMSNAYDMSAGECGVVDSTLAAAGDHALAAWAQDGAIDVRTLSD
jgi:hypothetical protein